MKRIHASSKIEAYVPGRLTYYLPHELFPLWNIHPQPRKALDRDTKLKSYVLYFILLYAALLGHIPQVRREYRFQLLLPALNLNRYFFFPGEGGRCDRDIG